MQNKGISPLIATVLLIAFVLAVAGVVGGWLTTITRTGTTEIGRGFALQVNCTKAVLDIVDQTCSSNTVTVSVANIGPVSLNVNSLYARAANDTTCLLSFSTANTMASANITILSGTCTGFGSGTSLQFVRVSANCQNQVAISMDKDNIADSCA